MEPLNGIKATYRGDPVYGVWKRWAGTYHKTALTQDEIKQILEGRDVPHTHDCPLQYRTELWIMLENAKHRPIYFRELELGNTNIRAIRWL